MRLHKNRAPTHLGAILRDDVLSTLNISISQAARELGLSRQMLHDILAERRPITAHTAVRLGKFCGNGPELWHNMQAAYDLWHAEKELAQNIAKIPTHSAA